MVKVTSVRGIAGQIVNRNTLTGLILVLQSQMTNQAQKAVELLPFKVEIFQVCFLTSIEKTVKTISDFGRCSHNNC